MDVDLLAGDDILLDRSLKEKLKTQVHFLWTILWTCDRLDFNSDEGNVILGTVMLSLIN